MDVLAIYVDGVNIIADVPESSLFEVIADIARASEDLVRGESRAAVTLGSPPVHLLLVRKDSSILVTLVLSGPPPELRLHDFEIDARAFFAAVKDCVESFRADLAKMSPKLASSSFGRGLASRMKSIEEDMDLSRWRREQSAFRPARPPPSGESVEEGVSCTFNIDESLDPFPSTSGEGDLYSLLSMGRVELLDASEREIVGWDGPPVLAFRAAVADMGDVLSAWESDEQRAGFFFGENRLVLDLTGGAVRSSHGVHGVSPLRLVAAVLRASLSLCEAIVSRAPRQKENCYLTDLSTEASKLLRQCVDLIEGDVTTSPPSGDVSASSLPLPTVSSRPLAAFNLRRVLPRRRWTFDAGPLLPGGCGWLGRNILVAGEDGAFALDPIDGQTRWCREDAEAVWFGPRRSDPLLLSTRMGLDLVTAGGATAWTAPSLDSSPIGAGPYLRGGGSILFCDGRGTLLAFREADGRPAWSFSPPGAGRSYLGGGHGGALLAGDNGFLYGIEGDTGRLRWRIRTALEPIASPLCMGDEAVVIGPGESGPALQRVDVATGHFDPSVDLPLDEAAPLVRTGAYLVVPGHVSNEAAVVIIGPGRTERRVVLHGLAGVPTVMPIRNRIYVADRFGTVAALGARGTVLWEHRLDGLEEPHLSSPLLCASRGVILVSLDGLHVLAEDDGRLLGEMKLESVAGSTHMVANDRLEVFLADSEGGVEACFVGTHLSIVDGGRR